MAGTLEQMKCNNLVYLDNGAEVSQQQGPAIWLHRRVDVMPVFNALFLSSPWDQAEMVLKSVLYISISLCQSAVTTVTSTTRCDRV